MARHHHHHHSSASLPTTITRPPLARYLSIFLLLLTPILTIIAFSLTLAAIYTPQFALSHPLNIVSVDDNGQALTAINHNLTYKRAPFYTCGPDIGTYDNASIIQHCTRIHGIGKKGLAECAVNNPGDDQLCQKLVGSANLYVAGAVLVGLALGLSLIVSALDWRHASSATWEVGYSPINKTEASAENGGEADANTNTTPASSGGTSALPSIATSLLQNIFILFLLLAGICLIFAQVLGVQALVNEQRPTASELPNALTRWFMGKGAYAFTSTAYVAAFLGAFAAATGCGLAGR